MNDPIRVYESLPSALADSFSLGTDTLRIVYRGDDPDEFILVNQSGLEMLGFRIRNYSCDNDQHTAEIRAAHPGLRALEIIGIASDLYMEYRDTRASLTIETGDRYITARGGQITWARKEGTHGTDNPGGRSDPPARGTTGRDDVPGPGAGSPPRDPGKQERQDLP